MAVAGAGVGLPGEAAVGRRGRRFLRARQGLEMVAAEGVVGGSVGMGRRVREPGFSLASMRAAA